MDESSSQEPKKDAVAPESVDLSALKSFSFGTQWAEAPKAAKLGNRPRDSGDGRSERFDRRSGGNERRDRRPQRPPHAGGREGGAPSGPREGGRSFDRAEAGRENHGDRRQADFGRGPRRGPQGQPPRPYESPVFEVCFYPDDNCFSAIIKAMRSNHLTYELFQVAKLFMEKPDRFIASITRRAAEGEKPEKVYICAADNMPFASEEEAISHVVNHAIEAYFDVEEVEVEPPTGAFLFVNRCTITKELLGPPNYHKYESALRHHHRTRLSDMTFERVQAAVETVREEAVVQQWLESQKRAKRYSSKASLGEETRRFNSLDDVLGYLRTEGKVKVVKQVAYARVQGSILEQYKETEAYRAMDGERQRQQRFPLDTANAIRGRMRREKFSIYKKGSKGVTYVCSVKRNFRSPGQVMAPALDRLIRYLEAHPMSKGKELTAAYQAWLATEAPNEPFDERKLARDLHWLIADGYVSHFEDDSLFAQPVLEAGSSGGDHDDHPPRPERRSGSRGGKAADSTSSEAPSEAGSTESPSSQDNLEAADSNADAESVTAPAEAPGISERELEQPSASNEIAPESETTPEQPPSADSEAVAIEEAAAAPASHSDSLEEEAAREAKH